MLDRIKNRIKNIGSGRDLILIYFPLLDYIPFIANLFINISRILFRISLFSSLRLIQRIKVQFFRSEELSLMCEECTIIHYKISLSIEYSATLNASDNLLSHDNLLSTGCIYFYLNDMTLSSVFFKLSLQTEICSYPALMLYTLISCGKQKILFTIQECTDKNCLSLPRKQAVFHVYNPFMYTTKVI